MILTHTPPPEAAIDAAQLALTTSEFDEDYLRTWFTDTLGGRVDAIPGGFRLSAYDVAFPCQGSFRKALTEWARFVLGTSQPAPGALRTLLILMDQQDDHARLSILQAAVIASGGTWISASPTVDWPASHCTEISVMSILGRGWTPLDALRDWMKAARRTAMPPPA